MYEIGAEGVNAIGFQRKGEGILGAMSYLLFLDDIRDPSWVHWCTMPRVPDSDWAIVRNHDQFVALVEREGIPALVAFDHDLDAEGMLDESRNGMDCLQWL